MSEDAQNSFTVTVAPAYTPAAAELKDVSGDAVTSDSSNFYTNDNNVSFINITYTIPPHPLKALFNKKIPPKKILDDVRYNKNTYMCIN